MAQSKRLSRKQRQQRGAVLITVMVVMLVVMFGAGSLMTAYGPQETRALENQLADIRIKWAMYGHVNYALSRAASYSDSLCDPRLADDANNKCNCATTDPAGSRTMDTTVNGNFAPNIFCTGDNDERRRTVLGLLFDEIHNSAKDGTVTDPRTWTYNVGTGDTYSFDLSETLADVNTGTEDGRTRITVSLSGRGTHPSIQSVQVAPLYVDFCFSSGATCSETLATSDQPGATLLTNILRGTPN